MLMRQKAFGFVEGFDITPGKEDHAPKSVFNILRPGHAIEQE
jgi:hypothetical protein